ncbi:helix-turn-helix transcriptional regulator [Streptomyces sp. SID14478]|uniref:helix-turn-helix domain-containing protein n=1 Tax=Streptomyces sp. SID14478 TaxID=2706073 RepID=UPI0013DC88EF|nr:helix-turn-helix domain-containing protein [Streptomyces sp. SID14478]NEB78360.1 helix-turn-helix transcriptional regulator [Streptomyces sp. SID14478]
MTELFAVEVGRRVRRLRRLYGLSLSELAQRASIGKATLSGLETGTRNPTLETLYAISTQLNLPLTVLLADPDPAERPEEIHGTAVSATLLETFTDQEVTSELYRIRIRPGITQVSPPHQSGVTEHLTVFAGSARVGPATKPIVVPAGSHAHWPADIPHIYTTDNGVEVHASLTIRHRGPVPAVTFPPSVALGRQGAS